MLSPVEPRDAPLTSFSARGLSLAGLMLLVLYLTILAGAFFPIAVLDPAWQLKLGSTLINSSPVPLTGLALLHLGATLDRQDPLLFNRREWGSRLAIAASLGFLLLIPLLSSASLMQAMNQSVERNSGLGRATQQLERLQLAVNQADSVQDLDQRLQAIQGPQLEATDRNLPLPEVKLRVQAVLDRASRQIASAKQAAAPTSLLSLLPEILRTAVGCLALAIAFAGLARRRGSDNSFLLEALGAGKQRRPIQVNRAEQPPL
jgi:hypothetical protein